MDIIGNMKHEYMENDEPGYRGNKKPGYIGKGFVDSKSGARGLIHNA